MPQEHIIFVEQTTDWTTWDTPDKAIPVDTFAIDPGIEYHDHRVTGQNRSLKYSWLGQKLVTGSFEMLAWWEYLGWFFKAALMHDVASTVQGATTAYLHGFFPKDDTMPLGMSVQAKRDADDASNLIGMLIDSLTFNMSANEPVMLSGDFIAYDEADTGGTWDNDASAAPAVIASPTYFADSVLPFRFQHATLTFDGTLTFDDTENKYTISGGTAFSLIEQMELSIENNLDPRVFLSSRLPGNVIGGDRSISGSFAWDQSAVDEQFLTKLRAGTRATLQIVLDSGVEADTGFNYMMTITVPVVEFRSAAHPDATGSQDRRMQDVEFVGLADSNDIDFNVTIVDKQTSY
jgi:hypothetical protein